MMTGKAFLRRLLVRLDFMSDEDKKTVVSYYEKRIDSAKDQEEEEKIIAEFGSPEYIADTLRLNLSKMQPNAFEKESPAPPEEAPANQTLVFTEAYNENKSEEEATGENESADHPSEIASFTEEEAEQVTLFGEEELEKKDLDHLFPEVKDVFESAPEVSEAEEENVLEEAVPEPEPKNAEKKVNGAGKGSDLIFSKPVSSGPVEEIVHAMENPEIPPLYGEKVQLPKEETGEIESIDLSTPNDPTPEEVEEAKARTLAKAQTYRTDAFGAVHIGEEEEAAPGEESAEEEKDGPEESRIVPLEEETGEMRKKEPEETKRITGLFEKLFENTGLSDSAKRVLTVLLSIVLSPVLLIVFAVSAVGFAVLYAGVILSAVILFLIMVALVIGAVIELVYGFATFKEGVSVALIEIGIGLTLSGVVCAVSALIYEYLFAIVPRAMKAITRWLKKTYRLILSFLYGGNE